MIHSIRKGAGFRGVLHYVSDPQKGYLLGGSYPPETSAREIAADMGRLSHERSSKPVFHASLSLPPGERLDDAQWLRAASQYLEGLGYSDNPFVVYRHTDREHDHIHIVASRVSYGSKLVSDSHDRDRGMGLCRELEKLYELAPPTPRNQPTLRQDELHGVKSKGEEHLKTTLRAAIQQSAEGRPTLSAFLERLEQQGVGVRLNQTSQGSIRGISFEIEGATFAGSSLGREFSWANLQKTYGIVPDVQTMPRQPVLAPSSWSAEALETLQSLLKESPSHAGRRAAEALRSEGAAALADVANASTLALQAVPSARFPAHEEAPFPTARRAAIFTGTLDDPRAALALADALAGSPDPVQSATARLLLRHYATAAAEGSPTPDIFVERLQVAGITLDASRPESRLLIGPHSVPLDHLRGTLDATYLAPRHPDPGPPLPRSPGDRRDLPELLEHLRLAARSGHPAPGRDDATALRVGFPAGGSGAGDRPPGPDLAARHPPDLASGDGGLPRGLSGHGHRPDLSAPAVDAHAGPGPAAPARPEPREALSGDARLPPLAASGAPGPQQQTVAAFAAGTQLEALDASRFDLRLRGPEGAQTLRGLTLGEVTATLERLPAPAPGVFVRAEEGSPVQFVGVVSADAVHSAARRGFEPAILQRVSSETLAVWVRHAPVDPQQLPMLRRAARLAYGLSPEGPLWTFGPLATGSDLVHVSTRPYRHAAHLAESLAATRRAADKRAEAQLKAHRVPPLSPRGQTRGRKKMAQASNRAWLQNALAHRVPPRVLYHVLAREGARSQASAVFTARSALLALTAATPKAQLAAVARSLSLPTSYVKILVKAVRLVRHFL